LLQTEATNRRRLEPRIESVPSQLGNATSHLAQASAGEQNSLGCETESPNSVRHQRLEAAKSSAAQAGQAEAGKGVGSQEASLRHPLPSKPAAGLSAPEVVMVPLLPGHRNGNGHGGQAKGNGHASGRGNGNGHGHANGQENGSRDGRRDGANAGYSLSESRTGSGING
jgi:hypothetical protein